MQVLLKKVGRDCIPKNVIFDLANIIVFCALVKYSKVYFTLEVNYTSE